MTRYIIHNLRVASTYLSVFPPSIHGIFSRDNCDNCGIKRLHKISENEILINSNTVIDPIKWKNIAGQDLKAMILVKHSLS